MDPAVSSSPTRQRTVNMHGYSSSEWSILLCSLQIARRSFAAIRHYAKLPIVLVYLTCKNKYSRPDDRRMLMQWTVPQRYANHSKLPACISIDATTAIMQPHKVSVHVCVCVVAARENTGPVSESALRSDIHLNMRSWISFAVSGNFDSLRRKDDTTDIKCEDEREIEFELTAVVVCEAHSHEVFGRAVVIHLVTSVNTPFI